MKQRYVIAYLLLASTASAQTSDKDSEVLRSLLAEVHQLRLRIETMIVASQRVQIAVYRLQLQEANVSRDLRRLDEARRKCREHEDGRQHALLELGTQQAKIATGRLSQPETTMVQARAAELKASSEMHGQELGTCQAVEAEISGDLRNSQTKLADFQDRLDTIEKVMGQGTVMK